jgi:hypothetical protein
MMADLRGENRRFCRYNSRIPCRLRRDGAVQIGFVTDLSASGFFVQTSAQLSPGSKLVLELDIEGTSSLHLDGLVVRTRKSHRAALSVASQRGVGVKIESAPEEYFQLVLDLQG